MSELGVRSVCTNFYHCKGEHLNGGVWGWELEGGNGRGWSFDVIRNLNDWEVGEYEALLHLLYGV